MGNNTKLIIALDKMKRQDAYDFVSEISNSINTDQIIFKVNDLLAYVGFEGLQQLFNDTEAFFMLDPKYHDIGNTCGNYLKQLKESGFAPKVKFLTVHSSNGENALKKVMETKKELGLDNLKILGITALTSLNSNETNNIYGGDSKNTVIKLAEIAKKGGLDGVVCSAWESSEIKEIFGEDFITMTPGIRLNKIPGDDQQRVKTPKEAIENGSDNLVIGRPITQAENPIEVIEKILRDMNSVDMPIYGISNNNLQKLLFQNNWENILKYIGVIYLRPENGKYCKLASGLYSNAYINIGVLERYPNILQKITSELREKLIKNNIFKEENIENYIIMGAQMGSVRISSHLALALGINNGQSIYTEKGGLDGNGMLLKRHNIDLKNKKIILSEDIISAGSTIKKMIELVEKLGGKVVAVTCFGNRNGAEEFNGVPLIYCYKPPAFELYYDKNTPEENIGNNPKLPENVKISGKPKNDWLELVESMR
ncbi:MAG: orotidine-5'-phosphate decarboxylase [Candidatus Gracilibacteria bacterium]|nr:orotidine-5'-phosphate decarboxylase [Candidatus Gracilibacteria bacterium]